LKEKKHICFSFTCVYVEIVLHDVIVVFPCSSLFFCFLWSHHLLTYTLKSQSCSKTSKNSVR